MKQCILTVSTWLMNSERSLRVTVDLSETYPTMEAQGPVPELLRKVFNAYDTVTTLNARTHAREANTGYCMTILYTLLFIFFYRSRKSLFIVFNLSPHVYFS